MSCTLVEEESEAKGRKLWTLALCIICCSEEGRRAWVVVKGGRGGSVGQGDSGLLKSPDMSSCFIKGNTSIGRVEPMGQQVLPSLGAYQHSTLSTSPPHPNPPRLPGSRGGECWLELCSGWNKKAGLTHSSHRSSTVKEVLPNECDCAWKIAAVALQM